MTTPGSEAKIDPAACSCGCASLSVSTGAEACGCGCACCEPGLLSPADEIADLEGARQAIDRRIAQLIAAD